MSWKKSLIIFIIILAAGLVSFTIRGDRDPSIAIKEYYSSHCVELVSSLEKLHDAIATQQPVSKIRQQFINARLAYKKIELFSEYYYELDVNKINGPAIDFMEEEDPTAYQEPQGFQMIETFLYPIFQKNQKKELLKFTDRLLDLIRGLSGNSQSFAPENYSLDAALEEMYRIISLGITGFDAPLSHASLMETSASLDPVIFIAGCFKEQIDNSHPGLYEQGAKILSGAQQYLEQHTSFDQFNRMEFIVSYMNPACDWLGKIKAILGGVENPLRKSVIKRDGNLFRYESLQKEMFLHDDLISPAKIELGRKLFYDPALSANGKRSCASCHQPEKGFTDGLAKALQADGHSNLPRNTPTLWNAYLQRNLFYDSRQTSLDHLILEVMSNEKEMNSGAEKAALKLRTDSLYVSMFQKSYPGRHDYLTGETVVNSISMYLRTLTSYNSRFDQYIRGNKNSMSPAEIDGFNLFAGKGRCATCHFIPLFNGSKPPLYYYQESEVLGVPANTDKKHASIDSDLGRFTSTQLAFHRFAFKTPTLRNITLTAPYMHNGVFKTLEEVMDFYNKGGGKGLQIAPDNQTLPFDKLSLNKKEIKKIIAFLGTLTDTSLLQQPYY